MALSMKVITFSISASLSPLVVSAGLDYLTTLPSQSHTMRNQSALVAWNCVFIHVEVDEIANQLYSSTIDSFFSEVDHQEVVVGSSRYDVIAHRSKRFGHSCCVFQYLLLVLDKRRRVCFLQSDGNCSNGMIMWSSLQSWEDSTIDLGLKIELDLISLLVLFGSDLIEDERTPGAPEGLVCGGGNHIGLGKWPWNDPSSHQPSRMGNIRQEIRIDGIANLPELLIVNEPGVSRSPSHDQLRPVELRQVVNTLVIDDAGVFVDSVRQHLEVLAHCRDLLLGGLVAVGQMAAVREIQRHYPVEWLQQASVHCEVGWGAREGLHVHAPLFRLQLEGFQGSLLAECFDHVDVLGPAVVALAGVPFRVLAIQHSREGFQDGLRAVVLTRNQIQTFGLAVFFAFYDLGHL